MMREAAKALIRVGVVLLVLALLVRPFIKLEASRVADDLAVIVSGLLLVVAASYVRLTRE
jgi:uncharacterized membrane protein YadS